jgi:hypothetical protein
MPKRFFYICVVVVALILVYNFGATRASAQLGGTISVAACIPVGSSGEIGTIAVVGRTFKLISPTHTHDFPPIPGTDAPIAAGWDNNQGLVMLANGDTYASYDNIPNAPWVFLWNAVGSPTQAAHVSWGAVKAHYR